MSFVISFYILISLWILKQSDAALSTNKQCYKAKTCVHNNHEKCGVNSNGNPRRFLDSCDIFEFNCLRNTDFKKSPMVQCKHLKSLYENQNFNWGGEGIYANNFDSVYEDNDYNQVYANDFADTNNNYGWKERGGAGGGRGNNNGGGGANYGPSNYGGGGAKYGPPNYGGGGKNYGGNGGAGYGKGGGVDYGKGGVDYGKGRVYYGKEGVDYGKGGVDYGKGGMDYKPIGGGTTGGGDPPPNGGGDIGGGAFGIEEEKEDYEKIESFDVDQVKTLQLYKPHKDSKKKKMKQ